MPRSAMLSVDEGRIQLHEASWRGVYFVLRM